MMLSLASLNPSKSRGRVVVGHASSGAVMWNQKCKKFPTSTFFIFYLSILLLVVNGGLLLVGTVFTVTEA